MVVYFVAPLLDNFYKKINSKLLVIICAILLIAFVSDQIYSKDHPNVGKGITDYAMAEQLQAAEAGAECYPETEKTDCRIETVRLY